MLEFNIVSKTPNKYVIDEIRAENFGEFVNKYRQIKLKYNPNTNPSDETIINHIKKGHFSGILTPQNKPYFVFSEVPNLSTPVTTKVWQELLNLPEDTKTTLQLKDSIGTILPLSNFNDPIEITIVSRNADKNYCEDIIHANTVEEIEDQYTKIRQKYHPESTAPQIQIQMELQKGEIVGIAIPEQPPHIVFFTEPYILEPIHSNIWHEMWNTYIGWNSENNINKLANPTNMTDLLRTLYPKYNIP